MKIYLHRIPQKAEMNTVFFDFVLRH